MLLEQHRPDAEAADTSISCRFHTAWTHCRPRRPPTRTLRKGGHLPFPSC